MNSSSIAAYIPMRRLFEAVKSNHIMMTTRLFTFLLCIVGSLFVTGFARSQSYPPVYLTLVSHNEDNIQWLTRNYYIQRRNQLVQIANVVQSKGAIWDFQSDWRFLLAVQQFDTGSVVSNTNGKNLLRWFVEDKGVICDPHSHENAYNYADVAYLHELLGIMATKVVGGFLYDTVVNGNNWENLENGIYGRVYTSYFWRPDILWGGGTQNHLNDPNPLGAWKPQSMANYYVHDSTKHLVLLGHGCENHITDASNIVNNASIVRNIVDQITVGALPNTGFYPAYAIFNNGDLTPTRITKITEFIDSVAGMVAQGRVEWKSLPDIHAIWSTSYNSKPYWVMCENIPTTTTVQYAVNEGWNMASLPLAVTDPRKTVVFPSATSSAFTFEQQGSYVVRDTLKNGAGYWLKFSSAQIVNITGTVRTEDSLAVHAGWNLVGSISNPVVVDSIVQIPPGIISAHFFGYAGGYSAADTLQPGAGYWVKVSQNGTLVLR